MHPLLRRWLKELESEPVHLGPDPGSGAQENLSFLSIPSDRSDITADQLVEFLRAAQRCRIQQATRTGGGPVVFYAWHDEMAGQLRFSVARGTLADLPFRDRVEIVSDVREIAAEYLASRYRDGIPYAELVPVPFRAEEEPSDAKVRVWGISIS
jgi:hypothetical protein